VARQFAVLVLLSLLAGGCGLSLGGRQEDEEKEPHYLRGKSLGQLLEYKEAVQAYEEALKVNPDSASAHYQLAQLFESRDPVVDPAAAIYHYQKFLSLRPKAGNADVVKTHIDGCKLELARSVSALPLTPSMQKDFDRLLSENRLVKTNVDRLQAENRELRATISKWEAYYNSIRLAPAGGTGGPAATNRANPAPQDTHIADSNPARGAESNRVSLTETSRVNSASGPGRLSAAQTNRNSTAVAR